MNKIFQKIVNFLIGEVDKPENKVDNLVDKVSPSGRMELKDGPITISVPSENLTRKQGEFLEWCYKNTHPNDQIGYRFDDGNGWILWRQTV